MFFKLQSYKIFFEHFPLTIFPINQAKAGQPNNEKD